MHITATIFPIIRKQVKTIINIIMHIVIRMYFNKQRNRNVQYSFFNITFWFDGNSCVCIQWSYGYLTNTI